jgi:hypothetical protein
VPTNYGPGTSIGDVLSEWARARVLIFGLLWRSQPHAVQVLRTYPARLRRYPFAPLGERSIANAYRKAFARARRLIYIEDQYLWAPFVADLLASAMRKNPSCM